MPWAFCGYLLRCLPLSAPPVWCHSPLTVTLDAPAGANPRLPHSGLGASEEVLGPTCGGRTQGAPSPAYGERWSLEGRVPPWGNKLSKLHICSFSEPFCGSSQPSGQPRHPAPSAGVLTISLLFSPTSGSLHAQATGALDLSAPHLGPPSPTHRPLHVLLLPRTRVLHHCHLPALLQLPNLLSPQCSGHCRQEAPPQPPVQTPQGAPSQHGAPEGRPWFVLLTDGLQGLEQCLAQSRCSINIC